MTIWYLDSSAIVKFAVEEPESAALAAWRASQDTDDVPMTSELSIAEVLRAVGRVGGDREVALAHLDALDQLVMDRDLLLTAGDLAPGELRTLDAIRLASALAAGDDLGGVVTYDARVTAAARDLGLTTLAPRP
ncbi:MAG: type II toxin-antitoxin system VapC family toxin [Acidimicrobiales bacterium]